MSDDQYSDDDQYPDDGLLSGIGLLSDNKLCSIEYVAIVYGETEAKLASWRDAGDGPDYTVIEGRVWYPQLALHRWTDSRLQAKLLISRLRGDA